MANMVKASFYICMAEIFEAKMCFFFRVLVMGTEPGGGDFFHQS